MLPIKALNVPAQRGGIESHTLGEKLRIRKVALGLQLLFGFLAFVSVILAGLHQLGNKVGSGLCLYLAAISAATGHVIRGGSGPAGSDALPTTDLVPYGVKPSSSSQDLVTSEMANVMTRDRAAWFGTAAIALGVVASNTCSSGAIAVPIAGSFALGTCVVSIAAAIFIAVGGILQGLFGNNDKRGLDGMSPEYMRISGLDVKRGSPHDFNWFYPEPFKAALEANYVDGGPPLLFGESNCDGAECMRLWYSHTHNATGDGSMRRRVEVTSKSEDLTTRNDKRQDHESDKSNQGLTGGYVWDDHDATTEYSLTTDGNFAQHVVQKIVDENNNQGGSGKFGKEGVYCIDLDTNTRPTPVGTDGYIWYYGKRASYNAGQEASYMNTCRGEDTG